MQFLIFDLAVTLLFLLGYLTVVTLRQARTVLVAAERPKRHDRREWPRLSHPR